MRKGKFLIIVLVIAVMVMSVAFAQYSESFDLFATASAGQLLVKVDSGSLTNGDTRFTEFNYATVPPGSFGSVTPAPYYSGPITEYIGWTELLLEQLYCDLSILIADYSTVDPDHEGAVVLIQNAYPGLQAKAKVELTNFGTTDVELASNNIFVPVDAAYAPYVTVSVFPTLPDGDSIGANGGVTSYDVTIVISDDLPESFENTMMVFELDFNFTIK